MRHNWDIITGKGLYLLTLRTVGALLLCAVVMIVDVSGQESSQVLDPSDLSDNKELRTSQIKAYYDRCYQYYRLEQHDTVVVIADEGIAQAVAADLTFLEAQLLETKALSLEFLDIDKSIEVYLLAIEAYARAGQPNWIDEVRFEGVGNAHTILIRMYARKGDMAQAMHHYDLIESIVEEHQYYTRKAMYESMAFAQAFAGDFEEAIRYFKLSITLSRQAAETSGEVVRGLEENHVLIASYYQELQQRDSAMHYADLARVISRDTIHSRIRGRAMVSRIVGELFLENESIDSATYFLNMAYAQYDKIGDLAELSRTAAQLAKCHLQRGEMQLALEVSDRAQQWADESGDLMALQTSMDSRYSALVGAGLLKEAVDVNDQLGRVSDSISSRQNKMLTEAFAKRYEASEKQNQIELQAERITRQRTLLYAVGIITLLLLALSFMAYRVAAHRKRANQLLVAQRDQLAQLDIAKSNFFANVSHELKTPLTLILAPIRNALEKSKNNQLNKDLELAERNGEKLLGLVNEVLDLSKLESGHLTVINTQVNLFKLVTRISGSFASLCAIRKVMMDVEYHLNLNEIVSIDIEKLEKILTNLISNAIKFSPVLSNVVITVDKKSQDRMTLSVTDQGRGIATEDQPRIFQRYYQGDQGSSVQGGTGIGLALVSELVELMDGSIEVMSEEGSGSTFTIDLPYIVMGSDDAKILDEVPSDELKLEIENTQSYVPAAVFSTMPKVLIIEDDMEMSLFLVDVLSAHYQCVTAYNGVEGLDRLAEGQYDCVTCDVMMPEMDGFTFIKTLRSRELYDRTPVMMLTARTLEEDLLRGFALGVDDYVAKPFNKNEVVARITALITNKQARDQWRSDEGVKEEKIESFEMTQLKSAESFVIGQLTNSDIKVKDLADHMNYSVRQVTRIIKKLTGLSPNNFIKEIRLQKAHILISGRQFATIAEVRYEVGFQNASYFSKAFLERFGVRPGEL